MDTPITTPLTTALDARVNRYDVSAKTAYREMREHAEEMERIIIAERELHNMQMAACMTATFQNTPTSVIDRIGRDNPYWTQCYEDTCRAVDREMRERARATQARAALLSIVHIWQTKSEACADNSHAAELMAEKAREAIAQLGQP